MRTSAHAEWNEALVIGEPQRHGAFIFVTV